LASLRPVPVIEGSGSAASALDGGAIAGIVIAVLLTAGLMGRAMWVLSRQSYWAEKVLESSLSLHEVMVKRARERSGAPVNAWDDVEQTARTMNPLRDGGLLGAARRGPLSPRSNALGAYFQRASDGGARAPSPTDRRLSPPALGGSVGGRTVPAPFSVSAGGAASGRYSPPLSIDVFAPAQSRLGGSSVLASNQSIRYSPPSAAFAPGSVRSGLGNSALYATRGGVMGSGFSGAGAADMLRIRSTAPEPPPVPSNYARPHTLWGDVYERGGGREETEIPGYSSAASSPPRGGITPFNELLTSYRASGATGGPGTRTGSRVVNGRATPSTSDFTMTPSRRLGL
jgi:hypothetical protein